MPKSGAARRFGLLLRLMVISLSGGRRPVLVRRGLLLAAAQLSERHLSGLRLDLPDNLAAFEAG